MKILYVIIALALVVSIFIGLTKINDSECFKDEDDDYEF